ncbi:MAG: hypothetical protein JNM25_15435 [Planctomycetes bacterium]|nr:hypothetical protein [Planctomycetota bacterium]
MSWRRILLLTLAFVVALGTATWALLQNSDAATELVAHELRRRLAVDASVADTRIDLVAGRLSVRGLRIDDPTRPGQALLRVENLHVDVAANPLGSLIGLQTVVADGVEIEFGPVLPAAEQLLRGDVATGAGGGIGALPAIAVHRGRVRFTLRAGVAPIELRHLELVCVPRAGGAEWTGTGELVDLGATLHLRGDVDLASGSTRLVVAIRDLPLGTAQRDRLQELLGVDLGGFDAAARVRELTLLGTLPGRDAVDRTPVLELAGDLDGLRATAPDLPPLVQQATAKVHASTRDGGSASVQLLQDSAIGRLEVDAHATRLWSDLSFDVRAHGEDIRIDTDVLAALRTFAVGRQVVAALQPKTGTADLDLFLRDPHRRGGLAELELVLQGVAITYDGFGKGEDRARFPLPLVQARGRVRLRDDVLLLEDVDATIPDFAGGGTVRLVGRVETSAPGGEDTSLDIHADSVQFNEHLRAALTALLRDDGSLYDRLAPTGRTEVTVQVRPRSSLPGGWSVEVKPQAATMQWAGFPYRLDAVQGSVVARGAGVVFDLAGVHGDGTVAMRGRIPIDSRHEDDGGFEAVVDVRRLAIDDDLRQAVAVLAPGIDAPWRDGAPHGSFGGRVKVWRPRPDDPLSHDVLLELDGVGLQLPAAPWRAADLHGQIFVQGRDSDTRIDFDALRGRLEHGNDKPAQLAMLGSLVTGAAAHTDLAFVVRDLELDAQLGRTLEELGALGPGTWQTLRPSGAVDLVCRHEAPADGASRLQLVVQLLEVRSDSPILPRPAEKMTGELHIQDGELRFRDVRAELEGALVQASDGRVFTRPAPDGRADISFRVKANGIPVDDGLANLFSGPLHQAVLDRQLKGRADVDALALRFAIPGQGDALPFETTIGGQMRLYDVEMTLGRGPDGIRVEGIGGIVGLADSTVSETGGGLRGTMRTGTMTMFGQPLEAVEAEFAADAERIEVGTLTSRFHGGSVRQARTDAPALHYLLPGIAAPEGRLSANVTYEKVDVYSFLSACGWQNPPYSGTAGGEFLLDRLDGSDIVDAKASGRLVIDRGDLGVVPLFTSIYARLPAPDRPRFHHLGLDFRLADRAVYFDSLRVRSNLLGANGTGSLELDGYLDVRMTLDNLLGNSADPLVMPLIDLLSQNIVRFHLFGYLRDLHTEQRWVTERSPGRREIPPMPPATERQALPAF